jgi:CHASE2 domain-containing sensor protein
VTIFLFLYCCLATFSLQAVENRFAVILIDSETEREYGEFPLDRRLIAQGLEVVADMQAKGVVLKFFFDLPREPESDAALSRAIGKVPTILQARIDDSQVEPNPLPERFFFRDASFERFHLFSGESGWIPLNIFSAKARDIGFVDLPAPGQTDIVERYNGKTVRSLALCSLELAFDSRASILGGKSLRLGKRVIPLDSENRVPIRFPSTNQLDYIKFHDLLAKKIDAKEIKGKVVILGYDGAKIPKIESPMGLIGAHRYFIYALKDLSDRLDQSLRRADEK